MEINNEMLHSSSLLPDSIHVLLSNHVFRVLLILWVLGIVLRGLILILIKLIESDGQGNVDREESADYNDQYKNTENYVNSYYVLGEIDKALHIDLNEDEGLRTVSSGMFRILINGRSCRNIQ